MRPRSGAGITLHDSDPGLLSRAGSDEARDHHAEITLAHSAKCDAYRDCGHDLRLRSRESVHPFLLNPFYCGSTLNENPREGICCVLDRHRTRNRPDKTSFHVLILSGWTRAARPRREAVRLRLGRVPNGRLGRYARGSGGQGTAVRLIQSSA
jgi:hypothetical protein